MLNPYEKLNHFTATIAEDAKNETQRILDEVRKEVDSAMSAAEDEILNDTFRFIKNEVARERTEIGRQISRRMMDNKNALNTRREEMAGKVMDKVRTKLGQYVKTKEYADSLKEIAVTILTTFENRETYFYLRQADMSLAEVLKKELNSDKISFFAGNFELGGIMAECPASHMQIDESFDTKYSELRGHFAELFGLQLSQ